MKILHINTNDRGGAAKASLRLHFELLKHNFDSKYLVLDQFYNYQKVFPFFENETKLRKFTNLITRHALPSFYQLYFKNKVKTYEHFSFPNSMIDITKHELYEKADIIHLHYIAEFVNISDFFEKCRKPVIWTFHDMFPITGLEHATGFEEKFGIIHTKTNEKIRNRNKKNIIGAIKKAEKIKFTSPSRWLKQIAEESNDFFLDKINIIPHAVNCNIYKPLDKQFCRKALNLPENKKILLYSTDSHSRANKKFEYVIDAINMSKRNDLLLLTIGNFSKEKVKVKCDIINLGFIHNEELLPIIYSASDITKIPSIQESFSLVTIESMACGVPVVAFNTTGPAEIITHNKTGYLAEIGVVEDLAKGIDSILEDANNYLSMSINARNTVLKNYNISEIYKLYLNIYNQSL
jgi:glycosyltransferase involved in cell wall biosynthesis